MSLYCPHCFCQNSDDASFCLRCGGALRIQNRKNQLPAMSILAGRYLVGKVLGEGGFGITYAGYDLRLEKMVAVKEYFPTGLATRYDTHAHTVEAVAPSAEEALNRGKEKFLIEARTMSHFSKLPTVVDVLDFFNANGTAYIVMEYLDGTSLGACLKQYGPEKDFNNLYAMLRPVLWDLEQIHREGVIHRDISPSNLMLLKNGSVKLLDFGTARDMSEDGEKSMSVVLKHGFAPAEQYSRRGQQGAWTDIYALCATMYKLLTGVTPESAMDRQEEDRLTPPSQLGVIISPHQEQTLLRGLALRRGERIQTIAELMAGMEGNVTDVPATPAPTSEPAPRRDTAPAEKKKPTGFWQKCWEFLRYLIVFVVYVVCVMTLGIALEICADLLNSEAFSILFGILSIVAVVAMSYLMNRRWVFRSQDPHILKELWYYFLSWVATIMLYVVVSEKLDHAAVLVIIGNYVFSKFFVFESK